MTNDLFHSSVLKFSNQVVPHDQRPIFGEPGKYVFAQSDLVTAHAYAIKSQAVLAAGGPQQWKFIIARQRKTFFESLHNRSGSLGGFIYKVDATPFSKLPGPSDEEWISRSPATILSRRFVSIEDVMDSGVQVFTIESKGIFVSEFLRDSVDVGALLKEGCRSGSVAWLNQQEKINPKEPPCLLSRKAASSSRPAGFHHS